MKIIVAVCVYNRFENIKKWLTAWKQRTPFIESFVETQLCIIHNYNGDERIRQAVLATEDTSIIYIQRENIGYDMGALQDIARHRIQFTNDYNYILWCADDTIPVRKDFIQQYMNTILLENCGLASMKNSPHQSLHVRTSGWMVSKGTLEALTFPADPITSKMQCYLFEHKGKEMTLLNQIRNMGYDVRQVAPDKTAPLWDSGYWRRLNRADEYYNEFDVEKKLNDKIVFICTIYEQYPQIIASLMCQTYPHWELLLIHDGPGSDDAKYMEAYNENMQRQDARIKFIETPERKQNYGHPIRQWALNHLDGLTDASYVVITNADNYYVPIFCEKMLTGFKKYYTAVATYCDQMVHSYKGWQTILVKFQKGYIDCGGVMVKREIACEVGWRDIEGHSADWTYFSDIAARYNLKSFIPVKGCLLVHN